jgi:hypothetical protein
MYKALIVAVPLALVAPTIASAETDYTKTNQTYTPQKPDGTSSPRDASTGLPTGKRMHKPVSATSKKGPDDAHKHIGGVKRSSD